MVYGYKICSIIINLILIGLKFENVNYWNHCINFVWVSNWRIAWDLRVLILQIDNIILYSSQWYDLHIYVNTHKYLIKYFHTLQIKRLWCPSTTHELTFKILLAKLFEVVISRYQYIYDS